MRNPFALTTRYGKIHSLQWIESDMTDCLQAGHIKAIAGVHLESFDRPTPRVLPVEVHCLPSPGGESFEEEFKEPSRGTGA